MSLSEKEIREIIDTLRRLTPAQQDWVKSTIHAFGAAYQFDRASDSDVVTDAVLASGRSFAEPPRRSRQALSKDRFEFAFESALNASGITAQLVKSRTNRGHDITIRGIPTSLKTEAAANIKDESIHVSKWMELGRGWNGNCLCSWICSLNTCKSYDRIFTLRRLKDDGAKIRYELVEIPKHCCLK